MKRIPWLMFFLSLLIPPETLAQTQDVHALRIVTQAFEKAKRDNQIRQDTVISQKIHRIENLNAEEKFESVEKEAVFKIYIKKDKPVEELITIWPPGAEPPKSPVNFDKLLDAFLSRFYFLLSNENETIDKQRAYKIHFWPKEDLPSEKDYGDYILNRITGIIYVDEKTYMVREINASLSRNIDKGNVFWSFFMDRLDFKVEFLEWRILGLPQTVLATTKYSYRKGFFTTKRFQTHTLIYEYGISK